MASLQDILLAINSLTQAIGQGSLTLSSVSGELTTINTTLAGLNHVVSVFGRTGAITATSGDYTAAQIGANGVFYTIKKQIFTTSTNYIQSAGMVYCIMETVGGGGGGGGITGNVGNSQGAAGGGGGAYSRVTLGTSQISSAPVVTIGAGGAGGAAGTNPGSSGGATSIGTLCVANGASGGAGQAGTAPVAAGGAGGSTASAAGDVTVNGSPGGCGYLLVGSGIFLPSGFGGNSVLGGGAVSTVVSSGAVAPGVAGKNYGGGGAGANGEAVTANSSGGAGAQGIAIITEFCNQ